jgi:hypothetical protein
VPQKAQNRLGFTGCGKTRLDLDLGRLCNKGTTSVVPQKAQNRLGFTGCGKTRLDLDLGRLCNKGTTSVVPIKPIVSMLGFSPCCTQSRSPPLTALFPRPV